LAVQATTNTRQGYNLLAPRFDLTPYATPTDLIEACRARVDALYPIDRRLSRGADLACGTGRATRVLHRSCALVDGYDFSPLMLDVARRRTIPSEGKTGSFRFIEADLAEVDLPEDAYQRIVTFGAWGHILPAWRQRLIRRALLALAPGGVFYTVTADPAGPGDWGWWKAAMFDSAIRLRNRVLGDPFHMYYLLNDTLVVRDLLESAGAGDIRMEPLPRRPHPRLTLLMARRIPASG
jgi:SAM-dependent methyltransferase